MSLTFNPYNYTKVEQVKEHLGVQLIDILVNVEEKGYVIQEQFKNLDAYLCENYADMIVKILENKTNRNIKYVFVKPCCFFSFYDIDMIFEKDVEEKIREFAYKKYQI